MKKVRKLNIYYVYADAYNGKGIKYIPEVYNGYWKNNIIKN